MLRVMCACLLMSSLAMAAPPAGVPLDPALHEWFEHQHNLRGGWCCDLGDGHLLEDDDWRVTGDHYAVRIDGTWFNIAPTSVRDPVTGGPNPTGHAVVWYRNIGDEIGLMIYCFAPGWTG